MLFYFLLCVGNIKLAFVGNKSIQIYIYEYAYKLSRFPIFIFFAVYLQFTFNFLSREGNDAAHSNTYTYQNLLEEVCKFANVLKLKGNFFLLSVKAST